MSPDDIDNNPTDNPALDEIIEAHLSRRSLLKLGGAGASLAFLSGFYAPSGVAAAPTGGRRAPRYSPIALLGFASVPLVASKAATATQPAVVGVNDGDNVVVPVGYTARVLFSWGDPVSDGPAFAFDASQDWQAQSLQAGMHHDGIFFFPHNKKKLNSDHGLLCINHEYVDQGLLFTDGMSTFTPDKVRKSIAAHGVSVIEVRRKNGNWSVVRPSERARRITGSTPMKLVGPAAGSALLKTTADPTGTSVLGTLNNCGSGASPWGTYVTCEENFNGYFGWDGAYTRTPQQARYGITQTGFDYSWHVHDSRFNVRLDPNESNRFGWMVEIDPYKPDSMPQKLTALGRFKHESAAFATTSDGRAVVYSGDDERNNYIYKFVGSVPIEQALKQKVSPLAEGTLYVARFDAGDPAGDDMGSGVWIPLTTTNPVLAAFNMTIDDILVHARVAADRVGATKMDRPEWVTVAPDGRVYATLTNNSRRGHSTADPAENPNSVADEANPRVSTSATSSSRRGNQYGSIVRWTEAGDAGALTFSWDIFIFAGDPTNPAGLNGYLPGGNINGAIFGSPDGIWADPDGRIWIQTDMSVPGVGAYVNMPNAVMVAADPNTKEVRRFLVGPKACEVTGVCTTPDQRTMFVDIQHPGESLTFTTIPGQEQAISNWPDKRALGQGRPRSSTVIVTKDDGGIIGT